MKHSSFFLGNIILGSMFTNTAYAMDTENTPLVKPHDSDLELIVIEDAVTIQKAYDQNLRANTQGCLVFVNQNLSACAGLSALKDKLHLDTITYLNFSGNKLQEVPTEIFTTMPNLAKCDLSGNAITKMCHPIPPHQKLKTLLLYNNQLTHIPLEQLLQNVPLKQLTLHENKIASYEILRTDHPSLEELWIDKGTQKWVKQMIASRCPNLVAEMCEGDTTVQDANIKVEYSKKCWEQCTCNEGVNDSLYAGVGAGALTGMGAIITSLFALPRHTLAVEFSLVFGPPLIGGFTSVLSKYLYRIYCTLTSEERITKTILKQIAQYPPIIKPQT
jgi:hypothetical protein